MKVVIEYQGKRYESVETTDPTPEEVSESIFKDLALMQKFKMNLADGGVLILGDRALQSAVILVLP